MKLHLHHFSKIKGQKDQQKSRNPGFSYYFCMMIEGSGSGSRAGSGSGSLHLISGNGSGSGRPKNMWIRIRIRNTGIFVRQGRGLRGGPLHRILLYFGRELAGIKIYQQGLIKVIALLNVIVISHCSYLYCFFIYC